MSRIEDTINMMMFTIDD